MGGVGESLFSNTYFFADLSFVIGMTLALNTNSFKRVLNEKYVSLNNSLVLGGKKTASQQLTRSLDLVTPKMAYNIIYGLMYFTIFWNLGTLVFCGDRQPIIDVVYFLYPLLTAEVSAHDILLHSTKKDWSEDIKRRHVLFPVTLESGKVFAERLQNQNVTKHLVLVTRSVKYHAFYTLCLTVVAGVAYKVIPPVLYPLTGMLFLPVHREVLMVLDSLWDYFTIKFYKNKYDHLFGDMLLPVSKGEKHDDFGRQYQYFNFSCKALEKVCNSMFFKKARTEYKWTVAESKTAYYVGRGAIVCTVLMLLHLVGLKETVPIMTYYTVHGLFAYMLHGISDHFEEPLPRYLVALVEMMFSGLCFYKPILDHLSPAPQPVY